ncbi:MAG: PAS domain-containing protein, partial [Anaerolineae bacterium]|nr:PAS domain-containing protein [Anaerolineae bacterium]
MRQVYVLDKDPAAGNWTARHLGEIGADARAMTSVADLLAESEQAPPAIVLIALGSHVWQALSLIHTLAQEACFTRTVFIMLGPLQFKHAAFESGADDYLITPPDVIEMRKRVRLYLDRAELEVRLAAETRVMQGIGALARSPHRASLPEAIAELETMPPDSLIEHAAALIQERNLFERVVHTAGEAISLIDRDGVVLYANPAWEQLVGVEMASAFGRPVSWPPHVDNLAAARALEIALAQGT